jgi:hypothetical protein
MLAPMPNPKPPTAMDFDLPEGWEYIPLKPETTTPIVIPDIPQHIMGEDLRAAVRLLGFDPAQVKSLSCDSRSGVHVEIYARTEGSNAHLVLRGDRVATHRVTIKVVEPYMVDKP